MPRYDAQPFPRVFPAFDCAAFDVPFDANVFPAFDNALLLGLPLLFATRDHLLPINYRCTRTHRQHRSRRSGQTNESRHDAVSWP